MSANPITVEACNTVEHHHGAGARAVMGEIEGSAWDVRASDVFYYRTVERECPCGVRVTLTTTLDLDAPPDESSYDVDGASSPALEAGGMVTVMEKPFAALLEPEIIELERQIETMKDAGDPQAIEYRDHAQALVDFWRGRRELSATEIVDHGTEMERILREQGAQVAAILARVKQEIDGI